MARRVACWLLLLAGAGLGLWAVGCGTADDPWKDEPGPPRVVVTIPPLYSFVKGVGGDRVGVKCLCTTTGVHQYQMDVQVAQLLRQADCFLAVGLTLDEHFANKMAERGGNPKLRYARLGEHLPEKLLRKLDRPIVH